VRVAALYDIHGNLAALEAVLAEVESADVDAIVCGGDLVAGPFPVEVFDRLADLPNVSYLHGNADREVVARSSRHGDLPSWCAERLGPTRLQAIADWRPTVEQEIHGLGRVLFCHATPQSDEPIFTRITPDEGVVELFGSVDADVVVCGHTHIQFDRGLDAGPRVVNAGSVGMPYQGVRGAFWALLGPDVELRRTQYDVEQAIEDIQRTGSPIGDELEGWLRNPPDADETTAFWESRRLR
jgi:putative phosphoesterase